MNTLLGLLLHAIGGSSAGTFYVPFKKIKDWHWESAWLINGFFAWLVMPWLVASLVVPDLWEVLGNIPKESGKWTYLFGALWGVGGLTFGLSMRYIGMSLGYTVAIGFSAAFGTIIPPIYHGQLSALLSSTDGQITFAGVLLCLAGIVVSGCAGYYREKENAKATNVGSPNFAKGFAIAFVAGSLSSAFAIGLDTGKQIGELAIAKGTLPLWSNTPTLIVVLLGGLTTNFLYALFMNFKNKSFGDYIHNNHLLSNYFFSGFAGVLWYFQFMFYGMASSYLGRYDFASWTIHMAFTILSSNLWGFYFGEWKNSGRKTTILLYAGIATILLASAVIGLGQYIL